MKNQLPFMFLVGVILLAASFFAWKQLTSETTKTPPKRLAIGFMAPLEEADSITGITLKRSAELAKKDLKLDYVDIIPIDTKCDPKLSVPAMNTFVKEYKVVAVIGELCSGATIPAVEVATQNKVVLISPGSSNPKLTGISEYFFRTAPSDAYQGVFAAEVMYKQGIKKLAVLHTDETYGIELSKVVISNFERLGGTVVAVEKVERNNTELNPLINKIRAAKPDAFYFANNSHITNISALRLIRQADPKAKIYASDTLKDQAVLDDAKKFSEEIIVTGIKGMSQEFIEKYRIEYGKEPVNGSAAYDAFMALGKAIQAGATTGEEIKNKLRTIKFQGASGDIAFDANGDLVKAEYDVFQVKDGQFVKISIE
jgi:branched-chain amino acid transport system substrate-binding protein